MLEMLLMQYEDQFGEAFPLADFQEKAEIEVSTFCTIACRTTPRMKRGWKYSETGSVMHRE